MSKKAIIIGAGPAGLTAAYELLTRSDIQPIVLEKSADIGGICKTVNYKGNRIDIGGHRFFSKSDRIMAWWLNMLPLEPQSDVTIDIRYQNKSKVLNVAGPHPREADDDKVMLVRKRLSRILYQQKLFNYPLALTMDTARKLGFLKLVRIGFSYTKSKIFPPKHIKTLEDFFIKRFGYELYNTFFKDYTEKVWGVPCNAIDAEWGVQRIKGLSVGQVLRHAIMEKLSLEKDRSIAQKNKQTSLIERFLYPKYGPGQLWEEVAKKVEAQGGQIHPCYDVIRIDHADNKILQVYAKHSVTGNVEIFEGNYFFSSMPVKDLIAAFNPTVPADIALIAEGLEYRDFITVGVLLRKLKVKNKELNDNNLISDNWIYVQDQTVRMGRLQIFNNWSPFMVKEPDTVWLGLEYFCNEGDQLWSMDDETFKEFAIRELQEIGFIDKGDVLDSTIIRMEKTYPAYFGTYDKFDVIRKFTDNFQNLFLVGRNGMHKYNNSDHSMLTAMTAVDNIINGVSSKENIWQINTEQDYHEST